MRSDRIIKRQGLKEQLKDVRARIGATRPFIEAEKKLRQAFQAGYDYRVKEEVKAKEQAEKDRLQAQSLEPLTEDTVAVQASTELTQARPSSEPTLCEVAHE